MLKAVGVRLLKCLQADFSHKYSTKFRQFRLLKAFILIRFNNGCVIWQECFFLPLRLICMCKDNNFDTHLTI